MNKIKGERLKTPIGRAAFNDVEAIETLKESCIYYDLATSIFGHEVIKGAHNDKRPENV